MQKRKNQSCLKHNQERSSDLSPSSESVKKGENIGKTFRRPKLSNLMERNVIRNIFWNVPMSRAARLISVFLKLTTKPIWLTKQTVSWKKLSEKQLRNDWSKKPSELVWNFFLQLNAVSPIYGFQILILKLQLFYPSSVCFCLNVSENVFEGVSRTEAELL